LLNIDNKISPLPIWLLPSRTVQLFSVLRAV